MNKQPTTVRTYLLRGAFLLSLAFVIVMPLALGQRASHEVSSAGGPCDFQVLIVYADIQGLPTQFQSEIQAEPNVVTVDLFDAASGTPTLAQLQQYEIVVPFSDVFMSDFLDADTLGNNLADYVDGGGVVVQYGLSHSGPGSLSGVNGRWLTGGYNPYDYSLITAIGAFSLGTFDAGHPLMAGVTTLNSESANFVTPNAAATEVAQDSFGDSLVAFRPVSGGHTTVGVTAYVGAAGTQSGDWGRVVVNAGNWLLGCGPTPTPTATPTPTPTPGQIRLTAKGHTVNGRDVVHLRWTGANSPRVDIRRDGVKIATVLNTGSYTDLLTVHGIYTYQVCEAHTMNCSNEVTVRFLP